MCPYLEDLIKIAEQIVVLADLNEDEEVKILANKIIKNGYATEQYYEEVIREIEYGEDY